MKGLNHSKTLSILSFFVLTYVFCEWFPYLLFLVINFANVDNNSIIQMVSFIGIFLSPLFYTLISQIPYSWLLKKKQFFILIFYLIIIVLLVLNGMLIQFFFHNNSTHLLESLFLDENNSQMIGLVGSLTPELGNLLFTTNLVLFYIFVPLLFLIIRSCGLHSNNVTGFLLTNETFSGIALFSLYAIFRTGSFFTTPLRFVNLLGLVLFLSVFASFFNQNREAENQELSDHEISSFFLKKYSQGSGRLFLIVFGLFIGAPSLTMNGLLVNGWVWIGFLMGWVITKTTFIQNFIKTLSKFMIKLIWGFLVILAVLLILAQINGFLMQTQPWIISIGLFLMNIVWDCKERLLSQRRNHKVFEKKLFHHWITFDWCFWFLGGYTLSFIAGIQDPVSSVGVAVFIGLYYIIGLNRSRKR